MDDEVIRLAGLGEDLAEWPAELHEPIATADVNPFLWMLRHIDEPDRVNDHHHSRVPEALVGGAFGGSERETATIGGQDRESLGKYLFAFLKARALFCGHLHPICSTSLHRVGEESDSQSPHTQMVLTRTLSRIE